METDGIEVAKDKITRLVSNASWEAFCRNIKGKLDHKMAQIKAINKFNLFHLWIFKDSF
ncbi:hypothetical protein MspRI1_18150 [Marinobacter sp. RI1]